MCVCTHSLAVDHIGCSICLYQSSPILLFFLSMLCLVLNQLCTLEWIFGFHNVTLEAVG